MRGSQPLSQTNLAKQVEMSIIPYRSIKDQATMAVGWLGPCLEAFSHVHEWGWERKCPKNSESPPPPPPETWPATIFRVRDCWRTKSCTSSKGKSFLIDCRVWKLSIEVLSINWRCFCNVFHPQFICPHWWLHGLTEQLFFATEHKCHANFKGVWKGWTDLDKFQRPKTEKTLFKR